MFHSVCVSVRAGGARTPCPLRRGGWRGGGVPAVCMCVCACAWEQATGLGRAVERLAKPRRSTPRAAPALRRLRTGGDRGSRGRCGVRLRGQRSAGCAGTGEGEGARSVREAPVPRHTGGSPQPGARGPSPLSGGESGAGMGGPGRPAPPAGGVPTPGTRVARRAGAAPAPPAPAGGAWDAAPSAAPAPTAAGACGGCPRAGRCRASVPARQGAPRTAVALPFFPQGSPRSLAAEGSGHPAGPLLESWLWPIASRG